MGSVQNADSGPLCCNPDCEQRRHCCRGESGRPRTPLRLSHPLRCAQPLWLQRRLQICHQEKQGSAQPVSDPWWQNGACLPQPWAEVFQVQELQQHHSQGHLQGTSWGSLTYLHPWQLDSWRCRPNLRPSHLLWERWGDLLHTVLHPCRCHLCRLQRVPCSTTSSSTHWLPRMPCHWWRRPQPRKPGHCRLDGGRASGLGWSLQENQSGGQQLFNPGCSWHHVRV